MIINNFIPTEKVFQNNIVSDNKVNSNGDNFQNILKDSLDKLNEKQVEADNITNDFISGKNVDVHQMMLGMEEAKMSLQLAIQVRNKVVEAVQELTRMQL